MMATQTLNQIIQQRVGAIAFEDRGEDAPDMDALLYMGNWHDAIPRAVLIDPILQSVDKCVYMFFRTFLNAGSSRMPTYDEIGRHLNLSRGTIARSLNILRAARWITLCNSVRDGSGRFKGNIYALHDEVVGIEEAVVLDGDYIVSLEAMESQHPHGRVKAVAHAVLENIRRLYGSSALENSDEVDRDTGTVSRFMRQENPVQFLDSADLDSDEEHPVQNLDWVKKPQKNHKDNVQVQKLDWVVESPHSSSSYNNKTTTTENPDIEEINCLIWPSRFNHDHKRLAWYSLRQCGQEFHQLLLDECAARSSPSSKNPIRNPTAWISWAVKEILKGNMPISNKAIDLAEMRQRECRNAKPSQAIPSHPQNPSHVTGMVSSKPVATFARDGQSYAAARKGVAGMRDALAHQQHKGD